jgi:hypothetical protein
VRVGFLLVAFFLVQGCETPRQKEARVAYTRAVADSASQRAVAGVMDQISDLNTKVMRTQSITASQMDSLRALVLAVAAKGGGEGSAEVAAAINNIAGNQQKIIDDVRSQLAAVQTAYKAELADSMQTVRGGLSDLRKQDAEIIGGVSKTLMSLYPHVFKGKMETSGKWRWNWYWYETVKPPLLEPSAADLAKGYEEKNN